jgi:hypothetical protein
LHLGSREAVLAGVVPIDDAETLAGWLRTRGRADTPARVDLAGCTHLHTAVLQVLLSARVQLEVPPADPFLKAWVVPLLDPVPDPAAGRGGEPGRNEDPT